VVALLLLLAQAAPARALLDEGVSLSHQGNFAAAGDRFVRAIALDPAQAEAHYLLGLVRQQDGRKEPALESFKRAASLDARYGEAQARICELETDFALARESGYERAAAACRRSLTLLPRDAESHFHLGRVQMKLGPKPAALASLRTAVRLDPEIPGAQFELALAHLDLGQLPAAIEILERFVAANPSHGNGHFQLGAALAKSGACPAAVPHLERAPSHAQRHFVLSGCYKKLGRAEDAARELKSAAAWQANESTRRQSRFRAAAAKKHATAGAWADAAREYRSALELTPEDASLKIDLAIALLRTNREAEVLDLLAGERATVARYHSTLALTGLGRIEEARAALAGLVRDEPAFAEGWYQLGVVDLRLNNAVEAERSLAKAVELRADEPEFRRAWAAALEASGNAEAAKQQRRLAGK